MRTEALVKAQLKYEEKNKDKRYNRKLEKIRCKVCDCEIARCAKARHEKSKKHIKNLA